MHIVYGGDALRKRGVGIRMGQGGELSKIMLSGADEFQPDPPGSSGARLVS